MREASLDWFGADHFRDRVYGVAGPNRAIKLCVERHHRPYFEVSLFGIAERLPADATFEEVATEMSAPWNWVEGPHMSGHLFKLETQRAYKSLRQEVGRWYARTILGQPFGRLKGDSLLERRYRERLTQAIERAISYSKPSMPTRGELRMAFVFLEEPEPPRFTFYTWAEKWDEEGLLKDLGT